MEIDVSKCKYLNNNGDCDCSSYSLFDMTTRFVKCSKRKNCYYKQLQQLKSTLDEIEEILKETQVYSSNPIHDKILQKIKEVKGE